MTRSSKTQTTTQLRTPASLCLTVHFGLCIGLLGYAAWKIQRSINEDATRNHAAPGACRKVRMPLPDAAEVSTHLQISGCRAVGSARGAPLEPSQQCSLCPPLHALASVFLLAEAPSSFALFSGPFLLSLHQFQVRWHRASCWIICYAQSAKRHLEVQSQRLSPLSVTHGVYPSWVQFPRVRWVRL